MANIQSYLEEFYQIIKLDEENEDLRTSRDAIKKRLQNSLEKYLEKDGINKPKYFDQGSYAMGTGIKPLTPECSYDIDVGVKFDILTSDYPDPVMVKKWLLDSLIDQTDLGTEMKEPCVRVKYSENKKEKYHVDLAVYTNNTLENSTLLKLARGKLHSTPEKKKWEDSEPELLKNLVNSKFENKEELAQFRRVICFLKRWKDTHFQSTGNGKPRGIALTIAAYIYFKPFTDFQGKADDLLALFFLIEKLLNEFKWVIHDNEHVQRLILPLIVAPKNDLFEKMTNNQMSFFNKKLNNLKDNLAKVSNEENLENALSLLIEAFGEDFPADNLKNAFVNIKKPNIGFYTYIENYGNNLSKYEIPIYGYIKVPNTETYTPISSDRKVWCNGLHLKFSTTYKYHPQVDLKWRVVNTGLHVQFLESQGVSAFRGRLQNAQKSHNQSINFESTNYTGKHWIECFAFVQGKCIAKSKKFYINIFNPSFPDYV